MTRDLQGTARLIRFRAASIGKQAEPQPVVEPEPEPTEE